MPLRTKIALREPAGKDPNQYFSVRLKNNHIGEPAEYATTSKVFIASNIRGDFYLLRRILLKAGVIDSFYNWIFGNGHLVITGNCLGNEAGNIECLWLIYALEQKALSRGGYVHFILGENEITHAHTFLSSTTIHYAQTPYTSKMPYVVLYDGNNELKRWIQTKNIVKKIGNILITNADIYTDDEQLSFFQLKDTARKYGFSDGYTRAKGLMDEMKRALKKGREADAISISEDGFRLKKIPRLIYIFTKSRCVDIANAVDILLIDHKRFYSSKIDGKYERIRLPF